MRKGFGKGDKLIYSWACGNSRGGRLNEQSRAITRFFCRNWAVHTHPDISRLGCSLDIRNPLKKTLLRDFKFLKIGGSSHWCCASAGNHAIAKVRNQPAVFGEPILHFAMRKWFVI